LKGLKTIKFLESSFGSGPFLLISQGPQRKVQTLLQFRLFRF